MVGRGVTSTSVRDGVPVGSGSGVAVDGTGSGVGDDGGVGAAWWLGDVDGSDVGVDGSDDDGDDGGGDDVADGDGVVAAGPEPGSPVGLGRWPGRSLRASASFAGSRAGTGRTAPT